MAKNDESEAIVVSIGVDTSNILADLDNAEQSLKGRITEANRKLKDNKLQFEAEIQTAQLNKDWAHVNELILAKRRQIREVKEKELQIVKESYEAYKKEGSAMNADNVRRYQEQIAKLTIELVKAKKAEAEYAKIGTLKNQLGALKSDIIDSMQAVNPAAAAMLRGLDATFSNATKRITELRSKLGGAKGGMLVGSAITAGGAYAINSFFENIEEKAKTSAESLENLTRKAESLGLSFKEYSGLNTLAKLSGVDLDPAISRMTEMNKAIETAGANGNETTKILDKWNISLRNSDGTYKNFTDQLKTLAEGYQKSIATGNSYAYTVEVLGNSFRDILPLLKDYNKYQLEANELVKTGFADSEAIKKLNDLKRLYEVQEGQNKYSGYLGVEGATEYYKNAYQTAQEWAKFNRENKELMKNLSHLITAWEGGFAKMEQSAMKIVAEMGATENGRRRLLSTGLGAVGTVGGGMLLGPAGAAVGGAGLYALGDWIEQKFIEPEYKKQEAAKATIETQRKQKEVTEENTLALKAQAEAAEKITEVNNSIDEKIFALTHSSEENELHALEAERDKYLNSGADNSKVAELYDLQRAKITEKYREQAEKAQAEAIAKENAAREKAEQEYEAQLKKREEAENKLAEEAKKKQEERENAEKAISSVFASEFQKRLNQIEEEKNAWLKAGADELEATKAIELEKRKARESEAERYLRNNADLIKRASKLEAAGMSQNDIMNDLQAYQTKKQYKDLGLNANQIDIGSKYLNVLDNLTSIVKSSVLAPITSRLVSNNTSNSSNITVNIDKPVLNNNEMIDDLAEKVAGKINDAIKFGGIATNGY